MCTGKERQRPLTWDSRFGSSVELSGLVIHNCQTKLDQHVKNSRNVKMNRLWENKYAGLKHISNKLCDRDIKHSFIHSG